MNEDALFKPKQSVMTSRPLIVLGQHIPQGQSGEITRRFRDMDKSWLYDVVWQPDVVLLTVREDEIMEVL